MLKKLVKNIYPVKCRPATTSPLLKLFNGVNKKDWLFLTGLAFLVILATSVPYVYGYINTPANHYFLAVSGLNKVDYPNYFSYIEQARQGHLLFEDYYTTEPQPRIILNLFFLVLGLIAKHFHLSALIIFHLARIILIPIFIFIFYLFLEFLFQNKIKQKICLILVCFSSGLGIVFYSLIKNLSPHRQPMDLWVPEAITFLSFYTNPLFIFSLTLIVFIFLLMLLAGVNRSHQYAIGAGLTGLILFQIHPYHLPTVFSVLIVFWLAICRREKKMNWLFLKYGLIFFFISLPSFLYYYWLSSTHWLTVHRITQALPAGFTPPLKSLLISYGLLWPLALIGAYSLAAKKRKNYLLIFLLAWLITHVILIYLPFPLQRRLTEGLHLIICLLASEGVFILYQKIRKRRGFIFLKNGFLTSIIFLLLFACSNIFVIAYDIIVFCHPGISLDNQIIESMFWLKNNSPENSHILATTELDINNLVPAFSVRKIFAGHSCETAHYRDKIEKINWFFNNNLDDQKKENFLKENSLDYILIYKKGDYVFQAKEKEYLKQRFENDLMAIYQVL